MSNAGAPLNVLQELGGWSDYKMVSRYAHLAPEHLAHHAANIGKFLGIVTKENSINLG
ncbi:tyrosine-type recombinase/integrase [Methylomonas sp. LL1]|uniref:tyrosine-type recombinase/integrase n=1 Tax=Methylomonas sp. LL1 TaxID=2785785 RepID=UPI0018C40618|nr:tyrosine-type recombinase/integrase [Methylomonas sp. LL1]QPK62647.1 tyrosine-type recombinase/integrase [Methylomonas sp. LL1]